ncbi:type VII secretion protein EssA [Psychrobacillus sp. OK028]|uniref:type VII secretion protein EssA n=1 Tax=Psychrobacillus sp. OK028 TaxID=1884359 RepID=UPI000B845DF3|nr:type VII secretion protein EssA [Psychrobacillus sp. OK028]
MKVKSRLLLPVLLLSLVGNSLVVFAEEPKKAEDLEPVIYEKLKFKKNTDYLHDNQKTEMKNTIPKKQFDIYFDGRKKLPNRADTSYLFQTAERGEKSTVTAKSSELQLFSEKEIALANETESKIEEESSGNNLRPILFLGLIAIGMLTLFVIFLPKLVNSSETTEPAK